MIVQEIKIIQCHKEEGGLFNSTKSEVEVVHVKGKQRDLKFELNHSDGKDLFK